MPSLAEVMPPSYFVLGVACICVLSLVKFVRGLQVRVQTLQSPEPDVLMYDATKTTRFIPSVRCLFQPYSNLGALLPTTWWNPGLAMTFLWRHKCTQDQFTVRCLGTDTTFSVSGLRHYLPRSRTFW